MATPTTCVNGSASLDLNLSSFTTAATEQCAMAWIRVPINTGGAEEYSFRVGFWDYVYYAHWSDPPWLGSAEPNAHPNDWVCFLVFRNINNTQTWYYKFDGDTSWTSASANVNTGSGTNGLGLLGSGCSHTQLSVVKVFSGAKTLSDCLLESDTSDPIDTVNLLHHSYNSSHTSVGVDSGSGIESFVVTGTAGTTVTDAPIFPGDSFIPAPVLVSRNPTNGASDINPFTTLELEFDVDIQAATGNITILEPVSLVTPILETSNTSAQNTNATTFTVDVPAVSTPAAGTATYVIIGISRDAGTAAMTVPGSPWNIGSNAANGNNNRATIIWRRYTSSASATTISITAASENYISRAWVISGAHPSQDPIFGTAATGNSTAANPPNLSFPWGTEPTFVGYYVGFDGNTTISAHPTGWTTNAGSQTTTDGTTANRTAQASSYNTNITTGSADPGALTNTNEQWVANTFAIRPADLSIEIEVISITDSGQVIFTDDSVLITPTGPLPESTLLEIRIDNTAIEPDGGGTAWAGFVPGSWQFTTGTAILISDITPSNFRMNESSITITGSELGSVQGLVYFSSDSSLGIGTDVDVSAGIESWDGSSITLNLLLVSSVILNNLGPGNRYVIIITDDLDETNSLSFNLKRSIAITLSLSSNISSGGANTTTAQLTAPSGKTSGDFSVGRITEDTNPPNATDPGEDQYTEDEFSLSLTTDAIEGEVYEFRLLVDGLPADTISVTPQVTVAEASNPEDNSFFAILFNF